jgi:hypothetical protein
MPEGYLGGFEIETAKSARFDMPSPEASHKTQPASLPQQRQALRCMETLQGLIYHSIFLRG